MDPGTLLGGLLSGTGVLLGTSMAGLGALRFFNASADSVKRIPAALERAAESSERQALASERAADVTVVLADLREGQDQIRISLASLAAKQTETTAQILARLEPPGGNDERA